MEYPFLHKKNIYIIPAGEFFSNKSEACSIVYSPLGNLFFLALPDDVQHLETLAENNQSNDVLNSLSNYLPLKDRNPYGTSYDATATCYLLLNEKCNFHCKYCYSAEGRSKEELSIEQIYTSLDYFLSSERKAPQKRTIMFMGGGEPTMSWELVEKATAYAEKMADNQHIELKKELSTNGSILNQQMIDFYKEHNFELQFSFDVIPDVQNAQRGQFQAVSANLKLLGENGVKCRIRSTITELNLERMSEMVEFCHQEYPQVKHLTCEHVVDPTYFTTPEAIKDFYGKYFNAYIKARSVAESYNLSLFSTSGNSIRALRERFCNNLYCLTPFGTFTTCPNVSSPNEPGYKEAVFAEIKDNKIVFDDEAYKKLTDSNIYTNVKCASCWAKWNCGSGCPNQRRLYTPEVFDELCNYMKRMLQYNLISELAEKYHVSTGKDFFDEITMKLKK